MWDFEFVLVVCILSVVLAGNVTPLDDQDNRQEHEGELTELYAVELDQHDEKLAQEIARKYGFEYGGALRGLPRHFKFIKNLNHAEGDEKRNGIPRPSLIEHPNVKWHEQQRELQLEKRGYRDIDGEYFMKYMESNLGQDIKKPYCNDPKYPSQWYINSQNSNIFGVKKNRDMGIEEAWKMGYTGKGVVAVVMDDGLDHTNDDLSNNFDKKASDDLNSANLRDHDPQPRDAADQYHGTKCSGEIAGRANNSFCGVGLAPDIHLGGIRMLDGRVTGCTESDAFGHLGNYIDIYSASWGPKDNGQVIAGPSTLGKKALEQGSLTGRHGKGSIYVWASGNGGNFQDNCGCDGYTSSIYTIAIGSVGSHGRTTYYDEQCAATMAVVYSGDDTTGTQPLVTTARGKRGCIKHFGGTSAAAPLAVGVFSLVLQANPRLTWRDLQHLVTLHSRQRDYVDMDDVSWKTNAAGLNVSCKFGFGLLRAPELIKAALTWKTVPPQRTCRTMASIKQKHLLKRDGEVVVQMQSDGCRGTENEITRLEHVQIIITLKHRRRGVLSISVQSPSKTQSELLTVRPNDESTKGINWPFMSVHFWGENPKGTWTLTIKDNTKIIRKRFSKKRAAYRDDSALNERSEPESNGNDMFKVQSDEASQPYRHEILLQDDVMSDEGQENYRREVDETNIFDVRSNVHGELDSWSIVQYGTNH